MLKCMDELCGGRVQYVVDKLRILLSMVYWSKCSACLHFPLIFNDRTVACPMRSSQFQIHVDMQFRAGDQQKSA